MNSAMTGQAPRRHAMQRVRLGYAPYRPVRSPYYWTRPAQPGGGQGWWCRVGRQPSSFQNHQLVQLRAQIIAYQMLGRQLSLPPPLTIAVGVMKTAVDQWGQFQAQVMAYNCLVRSQPIPQHISWLAVYSDRWAEMQSTTPTTLPSSVTEDIRNNPNKELKEFILGQLAEKKKQLECPVCLEVSTPPILMCSLQHLICKDCRQQVKKCPVCRGGFRGRGAPRKHRLAEQVSEEIEKLNLKLYLLN